MSALASWINSLRFSNTIVLRSSAAVLLAGTLILSAACGGGNSLVTNPPTGGGNGNGNGNGTPISSTVQGTAQYNYATASGSVAQSQDLTGTYIAAIVPSSSGWTTIVADTKTDGTFQIPGVPTGKYWLITPGGGYWTSATSIDLGQDMLGRSDSTVPQGKTYLDISLNGLNPWADGDSIEMTNANLNVAEAQSWPDFTLPDPGETSSETMRLWNGPLSSASKGDSWYASQLVSKDVNGSTFRVLAKATPALVITQTDGAHNELDGSMVTPPAGTVHLRVLGSQFAGAASAVNSAARLHSTSLGLYIEPLTSSKGPIGHAPTLIERTDQQPITADTDFGDISYGNPFPAQWTPFFSLGYEFLVSYQAAGAGKAIDVPAEIYSASTQLPGAGSPTGLVLSPVRNIKVNGNSLAQLQKGVSITPTLTWDPPATGTATGYRVTVYQLKTVANSSVIQNVIDLYTNENTLAIPDGILGSGQQYFFAIRALAVPSVDFTKSPNRLAFPWSHADALTAVISTL